jgi:hypothetical protein
LHAQDGWERFRISEGRSSSSDGAKNSPTPARDGLPADVDDGETIRAGPTGNASEHRAPPPADADHPPDPLHPAWWPPLTPLIEEPPPPAAAAARANAGDLIDRALFHAETTAACQCRHIAPPPPPRDSHRLWGAPAEDTGTGRASLGWIGRPDGAQGGPLPGPWPKDSDEPSFKFAPWPPGSSFAVPAGGAAEPHTGAPHPAFAAAGSAGSRRGPAEAAAANLKAAAECGQARRERLALLADEAEDGARLWRGWGTPGGGLLPGWGGAECPPRRRI